MRGTIASRGGWSWLYFAQRRDAAAGIFSPARQFEGMDDLQVRGVSLVDRGGAIARLTAASWRCRRSRSA